MPAMRRYIPTPLRPLARSLRDRFFPRPITPVDHLLSDSDRAAMVSAATNSFLIERGSSTSTTVRLRNFGSVPWSSRGRYPIVVNVRWLSVKKEPFTHPSTLIELPGMVGPGEEITLPLTLLAPDFLGHYLVEVDVVQTGGSPLRAPGQRTLLLEVQVTGRDVDDIDYHKAYATADLTQDYWTVVGPKTKEEFDQLAQAKFKLLSENGLTPQSRILDIGCGTGQLAVPLESYLNDHGLYFGTDIGKEAIEFCEKHYHRPNFRFAQSEMTRIPIIGLEFDLVTFFSVFTHTYPDETALLLAEARRLLAPQGVVIGDVFTSPLVERCSGNRGMMELNREHLVRLVEMAGLKIDVLASAPWRTHGQREILRFTRLS